MKRSELVFLALVLTFAIVIAAASLSRALEAWRRSGAAHSQIAPGAGRPRDLDMRRIEQLIRARKLSEHEASHYREAPIDGAPGSSRDPASSGVSRKEAPPPDPTPDRPPANRAGGIERNRRKR